MIRLPGFRRAFRVAIGRRGVDKDIDEEIAFHLDTRTDELTRDGMDPDEARRTALREFGDVGRYRRELRAGGRRRAARRRSRDMFDTTRQDLVFAVRQLWKNKAFTGAAVTTLALGIGATVTIFSVVNTVVLRPLPFPHPEELYRIYEVTPQGWIYTTSEPTLLDWQAGASTFQEVGAYTYSRMNLTGTGEPEALEGGRITHNLLPLLGVEMIVGRGFLAEEDQAGAENLVIILSDGLWARRFARDPEIVGRVLTLGDDPYTVIGVTSLKEMMLLDVGELLEYVIPMSADPDERRGNHYITAVGRLAQGISPELAQGEMDRISERLSQDYPGSNGGWGARIVPIHEWIVGPELGRATFVLFGAVGLLLLLACANVSNLLVARGTTRVREVGVRAALGAGRGRITRQLLTESLVLAIVSTALGVGLAAWSMPVVRRLSPEAIPRLEDVAVDGTVLAFAVAAAVVTCLLFGLVPALQAARGELHEALKEGGRTSTGGTRIRDLLVVAELALTVVVLVGAGLLGHSFLKLQSVDPGYDPEGVYVLRLQMPASSRVSERFQFFGSVEARIRALPGVTAVGSSYTEPLSGSSTSNRVAAVDWNPQSPEEFIGIAWRTVTPGFFETMEIGLLSGRLLEDQDHGPYEDGESLRIVVSEALADTLWPGRDPLGREVIFGRLTGPRLAVVGVVEDVRDVEVDRARPILYVPYGAQGWSSLRVLFRLAGDPSGILPAVRSEIRDLAPNMPIPAITPLTRNLRRAVATPRFLLQLFGIFAVLALALAAVGVYAVMMFQVSRRKREIGVRMALGAEGGEVLRMVLRQSVARAMLGLVVGLAGAVALTRLMASMLYEVEPTDPVTYGLVAMLLAAVAVAATLVPARQATRVDPKVAFTAE